MNFKKYKKSTDPRLRGDDKENHEKMTEKRKHGWSACADHDIRKNSGKGKSMGSPASAGTTE